MSERYVSVTIAIHYPDGRPPVSVSASSPTTPADSERVAGHNESRIIGETFLEAMHGISGWVAGGGYEFDALAGALSLLTSCEYCGHNSDLEKEAQAVLDAAWKYCIANNRKRER